MTETLSVTPSGQACGAEVTGIDLSKPLDDDQTRQIRDAWLQHHVLSFPDQKLSDDDLERFAACFGSFGDDPFFGPIPGREHIAAIRREADDTTPIFAESFHSDWSFMAHPPIGTVLYGLDIPPEGGDTFFVNQHKALAEMPDGLRRRLEDKRAVHSARLAYSPEGFYGDEERIGSMDIRPSDQAYEQHSHPIIRAHPESGEPGIFGAPFAYIIGIEDMPDAEAGALVQEMHQWQTQDRFIYRHKWRNNMLVMWDNRSVLHRASGGYEGHRRELHRITIYADG
jgi:taurine dioxygenase